MIQTHDSKPAVGGAQATPESVISEIQQKLNSQDLAQIGEAVNDLEILESKEIIEELAGSLVGAALFLLGEKKDRVNTNESKSAVSFESSANILERFENLSAEEPQRLAAFGERDVLQMKALDNLSKLILTANDAAIPHLVTNILGEDEKLRDNAIACAVNAFYNAAWSRELSGATVDPLSPESANELKTALETILSKAPENSTNRTYAEMLLLKVSARSNEGSIS